MNQDKFTNLIRNILSEELQKTKSATNFGEESVVRVPEMDPNGIDSSKNNKTFKSNSNTRELQTKEELLSDLTKLVNDIDKNISVIWDDHDDLIVNGRDIKYIRISPRWEDSYVIEILTRNEDRIWITGSNWEQVKEIVKINIKDASKSPTSVEKAYDKSYRNREDQSQSPDKGLNQKDKPKNLPLTNESPKTDKNKEKNYTDKQVKKDSDLPNQPMTKVDKFDKQSDHKVKDPVTLRKKPVNTELVKKLK